MTRDWRLVTCDWRRVTRVWHLVVCWGEPAFFQQTQQADPGQRKEGREGLPDTPLTRWRCKVTDGRGQWGACGHTSYAMARLR